MRTFIAIDFDELRDYFISLQKKIAGEMAKLSFTNTFHLTLKFLGEVEEGKVEDIKAKLKSVRFEPFSLKLDKIGVFPNENYVRVVWAGVSPKEEVMRLQADVEESLKQFNFKKDFKFHPHITLARVKFVKDKDKFGRLLREIKVEEKTVEIKNFKLIKSTLTEKGPIYDDLDVFE